MKCTFCNGRTIKTEKGRRCMKPTCDGANENNQKEVVLCKCGEEMQYADLNQLGEPIYKCTACRESRTL